MLSRSERFRRFLQNLLPIRMKIPDESILRFMTAEEPSIVAEYPEYPRNERVSKIMRPNVFRQPCPAPDRSPGTVDVLNRPWPPVDDIVIFDDRPGSILCGNLLQNIPRPAEWRGHLRFIFLPKIDDPLPPINIAPPHGHSLRMPQPTIQTEDDKSINMSWRYLRRV